jgi:hypothetical protein
MSRTAKTQKTKPVSKKGAPLVAVPKPEPAEDLDDEDLEEEDFDEEEDDEEDLEEEEEAAARPKKAHDGGWGTKRMSPKEVLPCENLQMLVDSNASMQLLIALTENRKGHVMLKDIVPPDDQKNIPQLRTAMELFIAAGVAQRARAGFRWLVPIRDFLCGAVVPRRLAARSIRSLRVTLNVSFSEEEAIKLAEVYAGGEKLDQSKARAILRAILLSHVQAL